IAASQQNTPRFQGERIHWRTFHQAVVYEGGRKTSSRLQGEPKWPGKHRKSSKCRAAWKSTCMLAPPASKRRERLTFNAGGPSGVTRSWIQERGWHEVHLRSIWADQSGGSALRVCRGTDHASRRRPGRCGGRRRTAVELRLPDLPGGTKRTAGFAG